MSMNTSTLKNDNDKFYNIANDWWDKNGKFESLHKFSDIRIKFITMFIRKYHKIDALKPLKKLDCLDVGCGGGILTERLFRLGGNVTGIDVTKNSIKTANDHAKKSNLKINYLNLNMNSFKKKFPKKQFDLIIASEVIEHVDNRTEFFSQVSKLLKNKGILILTTINRTPQSFFLAKLLAEKIFNLLPDDIHDFDKFVSPEELMEEAKSFNIHFNDLIGFKPILTLSKKLKPRISNFIFTNNVKVNYGICGIKLI